MQPGLPRWIAHRGGGTLAPENTLAGIRLAADMGFRAVEFDVMLSGQGTPVLMHDETLARTTNGAGRVAETDDAVLFALDAGGGEPVPRLVDALALCRQCNLAVNLEIKPSSGMALATADAIAACVPAAWSGDAPPLVFSSFSRTALQRIRAVLPAVPRALLLAELPPDWLACLVEVDAGALHCPAEVITPEVLALASAHHLPVRCYTVDDPEQAKRLFDLGVESIFTDRLDLFAKSFF
jgi:glycerophosphoryl diester phosphodiesterase